MWQGRTAKDKAKKDKNFAEAQNFFSMVRPAASKPILILILS